MKNLQPHALLGPTTAEHRKLLLTPRQKQVLRGVCYGWPNKRIAIELGVSIKTVEKHHQDVNNRVGNHSIASLVHWALKNNVIDLSAWLALERLPS